MNAASNVLEANMKDPKGLDTTAVANPGNDDAKFADPSGETMKVSLNVR